MISLKKQKRIELIKLTIKLIIVDGLTVTEACSVTGVSRGTVYRYIPQELKSTVVKYTSHKILDSLYSGHPPQNTEKDNSKLDT